MTITVTQAHIDQGCRGGLYGPCPVQLALNDAGAGASVRGVGFSDVVLSDGRWIEAPPALQRFVSQFDAGLAVEPFSFELEVP